MGGLGLGGQCSLHLVSLLQPGGQAINVQQYTVYSSTPCCTLCTAVHCVQQFIVYSRARPELSYLAAFCAGQEKVVAGRVLLAS